MKMEWTEDHDIPLAKKVLISEHYRFKPRAVYCSSVPTVLFGVWMINDFNFRYMRNNPKIWQYVDRK